MLVKLVSLLAVAVAAVWPHPHHPKAFKLHGAQGVVTVTYLTLEFNAQHLAELKPGFDWHLGHAQLKSQVDLMCGDVLIGKGDYKLNVRRGEDAASWSAVMMPLQLVLARNAVRRAGARGPEAEAEAKAALALAEADIKAKNMPAEIVLPMGKFEAAHAEHLTALGVHYGYEATKNGSDEPASGMECGIRVSFGDLHRELTLREVFAAKAK